MCSWITLLDSWSEHHSVHQPYFSLKEYMHAGSLATRLPRSSPALQESLQAGELLGVGGSRVLPVGVCGRGYDGLEPQSLCLALKPLRWPPIIPQGTLLHHRTQEKPLWLKGKLCLGNHKASFISILGYLFIPHPGIIYYEWDTVQSILQILTSDRSWFEP